MEWNGRGQGGFGCKEEECILGVQERVPVVAVASVKGFRIFAMEEDLTSVGEGKSRMG
jgi:hypothetical protein